MGYNKAILLLGAPFLFTSICFAQTITIEPIDGTVTRGTTGTTQKIKIKRTGDTSKQSSVSYKSGGSGSNPALSTDFAKGFPADTVIFAGDEDDPDCLAAPPAPAVALGMTKLDFCDGFKYDSIARGSDAAGRKIGGRKKWTVERSAAFGGTGVNPASDFTHNAATGEMNFALTDNKYQSTIQSVNGTQAPLNGYWIESKTGWYVEIKIKMTKAASTSQLAFWSMDMCHWSGGPDKCSSRTPSGAFLEPDWLEYNFGQTAIHRHKEPTADNKAYHVQCYNSQNGGVLALPIGTYKTRGVSVVPDSGGGTVQAYVDGVTQSSALTASGKCSNMADTWPQLMTSGKYPLLLGARVGDQFTVDFVRVWKKP